MSTKLTIPSNSKHRYWFNDISESIFKLLNNLNYSTTNLKIIYDIQLTYISRLYYARSNLKICDLNIYIYIYIYIYNW